MDQTDVQALQQEVQQFLDIVGEDVEARNTMSWVPSDGYLPVVFRAILRRQFEGLQVISDLVASGHGFAAGPLLRPSCEEFIWAKYLVQIPTDEAQQLVYCFLHDELFKSLRAQDKYAGRPVTKSLGLLPDLEVFKKNRSELLGKLRCLGTRLGWPPHVISNGQLPSVSWLAKTTAEETTYEFVYHATSRYVHFSVHELLRRGWGNPQEGSLSIDSVYLRDHWAHFCLYWGLSLYLDTLITFLEVVDPPIEMSKQTSVQVLQVLERIGKFVKPSLITPRELDWPSKD